MSTGSPQIIEFQCPGCAKRLKAGPTFAGKRVKCPQCGSAVQVPELPAKIDLDDDWLSLDVPVLEDSSKLATKPFVPKHSPAPGERPAPAKRDATPAGKLPVAPKSSATQSSAPKPPAQREPASADSTEPAPRRSMFDDDLPDLAELDANSKKPHSVTDIFQLEGLDDLVKSAPPARAPKPPPPPAPKPSEIDYRITCRTCGTPMHLKLDRVGKKVNCSDCHSSFVVPPPPAGWSATKKKVEVEDDGIDMPLTAPELPQTANTLASQRTAASEYLDKAKQELDDDEIENLYQGDFDTSGFMTRTFGFLTDPSALGLLVLYGFMSSGLFALVQFSKTKVEGGGFEGAGYLLVLFILSSVFGAIISMPMLSAGLTLLESVANRQRRVEDWPSFNVFDNFGEIMVVLVALVGSLLPGMLVGGLIGRSGGAEWLILTGMMGTCFLLFPVLLLSMLDNGSPFQPVSGAVITSIPQTPEAWGGYYLKTAMAFGAMTVMCYVMLGRSALLSAIVGFFVPVLLFFVCQQMGALADSISDHLSFDFTPPEPKGDKDKSSEDKDAA